MQTLRCTAVFKKHFPCLYVLEFLLLRVGILKDKLADKKIKLILRTCLVINQTRELKKTGEHVNVIVFKKKVNVNVYSTCNSDENHPTITHHHTFPLTSCQMYQ